MQRKKLNNFLETIFVDSPLVCVDVGAAGGPKEPWGNSSFIKWVGVEPQEGDTPLVLGAAEGRSSLYVTHNPDSSSLLEPNESFLSQLGVSDRYKVKEKLSVNVLPLDVWIKNINIPLVDFLKIDTQGTELPVLLGAQESLKNVLGVDVEVNFSERYKGQSYFSDVDVFLREKGFILFDLQRRYFKRNSGLFLGLPKGQLTHGTALYLRSVESFYSTISSIKDKKVQSFAVLRFASVALIYGYVDYARYIEIFFKELLTTEHASQLSELLESFKRGPQISFRGRYRLYSLFKKCSLLLKPVGSKGNTGDEELGNF